MKQSEIKGLSKEELVAKIVAERETLTKLKFAHTISAIENPSRINRVKKDIARLKTELTKFNKAELTTETN